jgi:hypothetical protein
VAPETSKFQYSVVEYLNEATVLLRFRTADVLPKWETESPSVRAVTNHCAKYLSGITKDTSELLARKISLTSQLLEEADDSAKWNLYNEMSGLRNKVREQQAKAMPGVFASALLANAVKLLTELDGKLNLLLDEAYQLNKLTKGVASQQLKEPIPLDVSSILGEMRSYNDSSKSSFWNLLDPHRSWNLDRGRIDIINRLGKLNDYPQREVLWARFLAPQLEAIEQKALTISQELQMRRGAWQLIGNGLNNVAHLLGEENENGRRSWYEDPFSISAKTQSRMTNDVNALCEQYT